MKQDRELFFTTDGTCNRRIVFKGIMTMRYRIIILEQLFSSTSEYDTDGDGIPHTDTQGWSPEKIGTGILWDCGQITMYPRYANKPVSYTESQYQHTIAHEFGHVLGLDDAYPSANGEIKLKNNIEVPIPEKNDFYQGILMNKNGFAYANDMEMILQAFLERRYQSYFDYKKNEKSRVIRLKQTFGGDD